MNLMMVDLILDSLNISERINAIVNRNSMVIVSRWDEFNLILLRNNNGRAKRSINTIIKAGNFCQLKSFMVGCKTAPPSDLL